MASEGVHEEPGPVAERAVSEEFFTLVVDQARSAKLLSDDHFTVDGTLIEAWAGHTRAFSASGTTMMR
jgi:transposase